MFDILYIYFNEINVKTFSITNITLSIDITDVKIIEFYEYAIEKKKKIIFSHDGLEEMMREKLALKIISEKMPKVLVKETEKYFIGKEEYYSNLLDILIKENKQKKITEIFGNIKINIEKYLADNVELIEFDFYIDEVIFNLVDINNLQYLPNKIKSIMEREETTENFSGKAERASRNVFGYGLNGDVMPTLKTIVCSYYNGRYTTKETFANSLIKLFEEEKDEDEIDHQFRIIIKTKSIVTTEEIIQCIKEKAKNETFEKIDNAYKRIN